MNRCTTIPGEYYLGRDVESMKAVKPNAAGLWIEDHRGNYIAGGIASDVSDIHTIDRVAEDLRNAFGDRYKFFLVLTRVNERRRQLDLPLITESELPHTV